MISQLSILEMKALGLLEFEKLSSSELGRRLKVSRITAARVIRSLRQKGFALKARRVGRDWFYEIQNSKVRDPMLAVIGIGSSDVTDLSLNHDRYLVEYQESKSR